MTDLTPIEIQCSPLDLFEKLLTQVCIERQSLQFMADQFPTIFDEPFHQQKLAEIDQRIENLKKKISILKKGAAL